MSNLRITVLISFSLILSSCGKVSTNNNYPRNPSDILNTTIIINDPLKEGPGSTGPLKEGPSTTGALKEGPASTGSLKEGPSTTGALKLTERTIIITNKIDNIENPVTPEEISSIEIVGLNYKKVIKASDIELLQTSFSVKDNDSTDLKVNFDGKGHFNFSFANEIKNLVFKFNLNESNTIIIPAFNSTKNIRAVINNEKDNQTILCGSSLTDGTLDIKQDILTINKNDNDYSISVFGDKEQSVYSLNKIVSAKDNNFKPDKNVKIDNIQTEKNKLNTKVGKISSLVPYIGTWTYKFFNQDIDINIFDKGNGKFATNVSINEKKFLGEGIYLLNTDNNYLLAEGNKGNASIRIAFELKNTNALNVILDDLSYKGISLFKSTKLTFSRKINK